MVQDFNTAREAYMSKESDTDVVDLMKYRNKTKAAEVPAVDEDLVKTQEKNAANWDRVTKARLEANKAILRSYRIKK